MYSFRDAEFQKSVCDFIGRKSDLLFRPLSEEKNRKEEHEIVDGKSCDRFLEQRV